MTSVYLIGALIAVAGLGILAAYLTGRSQGAAKERASSAERGLGQARQSNEIREDISRLDADELERRLRRNQ